ncbi:phage major tail tube protein [Arsenophonus sp. PmNCSU2021_1]|uniref:phage major tail tube protein n=1 Tax=Arsenophonus sp. PmNCSU2021_1 TaxID=3118989 RepID=UPI002FF10AFC
MAGNALHFMTNANVYLDGNSLIGREKEIKLPEINVVAAGASGAGDDRQNSVTGGV